LVAAQGTDGHRWTQIVKGDELTHRRGGGTWSESFREEDQRETCHRRREETGKQKRKETTRGKCRGSKGSLQTCLSFVITPRV